MPARDLINLAGQKPFLNIENFTRSDRYHNSHLIKQDDGLDAAVALSTKEELDNVSVSTAQGKFLNLLVKTIKARKVLEIGTLGG